MNLLALFEVFLLVVAFFGISKFSGVPRFLVPLACLFCMFWIQKLERIMKEDKEAKKRLLEYKLEKHHESIREKRKAAATPSAT
jgi:hypothetical protein